MSEKTRVGPPSPDVLATELDGEVSVYNPSEEQVTILNRTATDVWHLCDGTMTAEQIVELLARNYDVPADVIRDDVLGTIEQLRESGLLSE